MPVLYFDPTTVLFVSLFLILFAFFAVMNARSQEPSSEATNVLLSLERSFGGERPTSLGTAGSLVGSAAIEPRDASLQSVGVLVEDRFPGVIEKGPNRNDTIEFHLPLESFFPAGRAKLGPSKELFIKDLSTLIGDVEDSRLTVSLGFASGEIDSVSLQRRAALMAATFMHYGLEAGAVSIVVHHGDSQSLQLIVERAGS